MGAAKKGIMLWLAVEAGLVLLLMGKSHAEPETGTRWRFAATIRPGLDLPNQMSLKTTLLQAMPGAEIESFTSTAEETRVVFVRTVETPPQPGRYQLGFHILQVEIVGPA